MHRLRSPVAAAADSLSPKSSFQASFESAVEAGRAALLGGDLPLSLVGPMHYEQNYAYPLIVWLHGRGNNERQLVKLMPELSLRNYVGVGPRGVAAVDRGYAWPESDEGFDAAEQRVYEAIEAAQSRYHISSRRIFLAGCDAGGTLALRIALARPDRFGGALSLGGAFPEGNRPLSRLCEARRLPLFVAYDRDPIGAADERHERAMQLCFTAGMQIMLRQYPQRSLLGRQMLADVNRWIMDRVTGATA